jgi:hypothetical protein
VEAEIAESYLLNGSKCYPPLLSLIAQQFVVQRRAKGIDDRLRANDKVLSSESQTCANPLLGADCSLNSRNNALL